MSIIIARPEIEIDEELKLLLQHETESCTIVHCTYNAKDEPFIGLRIWPSTFLIQNDGNRRKLIKALNISMMPHWTYHDTPEAKFTLVFEGLTRLCTSFHLLEEIPEPGGFYTDIIARNGTDVYRVEIMC